MEDAMKTTAKDLFGVDPDSESRGPEREGLSAPEPIQPPIADTPTDEKALDRWFREQRGNKRVPKRLDVPNEAMISSYGPLKITGNLTLVEEDGNVTHVNHLTLCRCGASRSKPICDDQHLDIEFMDSGNIHRASDCMPVVRPQTLTITAIKDGPLKYRGYLRMFNSKGQECLSMQGSLCRCGKSTKKPFCDCQ
jgi:CDGSH-type Zn-finger protein